MADKYKLNAYSLLSQAVIALCEDARDAERSYGLYLEEVNSVSTKGLVCSDHLDTLSKLLGEYHQIKGVRVKAQEAFDLLISMRRRARGLTKTKTKTKPPLTQCPGSMRPPDPDTQPQLKEPQLKEDRALEGLKVMAFTRGQRDCQLGSVTCPYQSVTMEGVEQSNEWHEGFLDIVHCPPDIPKGTSGRLLGRCLAKSGFQILGPDHDHLVRSGFKAQVARMREEERE